MFKGCLFVGPSVSPHEPQKRREQTSSFPNNEAKAYKPNLFVVLEPISGQLWICVSRCLTPGCSSLKKHHF